MDLKILSDAVSKEIVKTEKFSKLNMKVNNLENQIPDVSTLIQRNQCKTNKQNVGEKLEMLIKNTWQ